MKFPRRKRENDERYGIGFNPLPEVENAFDIKIFGKDWEYLLQLVKRLCQV